MGEFSITHLLIIFLIVLIFFGPGRLPALGKSLGEAIRGFKKGLDPNFQENPPQQPAPQPRMDQLPRSQQETATQTERTVENSSNGKPV